MELTQEVLDKVYDIVRAYSGGVALDTFAQYGLTDRELVYAALNELENQQKIVGQADLFVPKRLLAINKIR